MKRKAGIVVLTVLVCTLCAPISKNGRAWCQVSEKATTQAAQIDKLDSFIKQKMQAYGVPGLALAVIENGKIMLKMAYGMANLETDSPVKTNSVFELASITKPFTATAIMMLVEEGKVRLDDPVKTYLSDAPDSWKAIKVRHLLTHTAGFPTQFDGHCEGALLINISAKKEFESILRAPLLFQAGENAQYSDPGYILLGLIIEKASGQSYREFIQKRIFDPLQMTDSSVLDQWRIIKNRVAPYMIRNGRLLRGRRDWQIEVPSNFGIYSTVEDLARFDAALLHGTLLKKTSLEMMLTPARLNNGQDALVGGQLYGFGWEIGDTRGHRTASHSGFTGTFMLRFLDDKLTIIMLTNLDVPSGPHVRVLVSGIAGLVNSEYQPPNMLAPRPDPSPETTSHIRKLMSDLAEGHDSPIMTPAHRAFYNGLSSTYRSEFTAQLKSLKTLTYIASDEVEGRGLRIGDPIARICYFKGEHGDKVFYYTFWLTKEGKVATMRFYSE